MATLLPTRSALLRRRRDLHREDLRLARHGGVAGRLDHHERHQRDGDGRLFTAVFVLLSGFLSDVALRRPRPAGAGLLRIEEATTMSLPADPLLIADDLALSGARARPPAGPDVVVRGRRPLVAAPAAPQAGRHGGARRPRAAVPRGLPRPAVYEAITGWTYTGQDFTAFLQPPSAEPLVRHARRSAATCSRRRCAGCRSRCSSACWSALISTGLAAVVGAVRRLLRRLDRPGPHVGRRPAAGDPVVPDHRDPQPQRPRQGLAGVRAAARRCSPG